MNVKTMLSIISTVAFLCSSCTIQGEQICGIWNTDGAFGKMTVEITPYQGKFYGYLLAYEDQGKTIKGAKTEEYILKRAN